MNESIQALAITGGMWWSDGEISSSEGKISGLVRDRQSPGSRRVEVSTGRGEKRGHEVQGE